MSAPWPPPPDLDSIAALVRAADPERHLAEGAPADEYEPEEALIFAALRNLSTSALTAGPILTLIEPIWAEAFALTPAQLTERLPALRSLAHQIEHFFGPGAAPQTRDQPRQQP